MDPVYTEKKTLGRLLKKKSRKVDLSQICFVVTTIQAVNPDEMATVPIDILGDIEQEASGDGHRRQATKDHSVQV